MLRKLIFILSFLTFTVKAQNIKFYGIVQDSTEKPLPAASLVAAHLKTQTYQGFSITDDDGAFEIPFHKNTAYTVKISYMGYRPVIDTIYTQENDVFKKYILQPDRQHLEGVEIKYEMPVKIKGDTIIYNADSFTTGNEKKLGDVLKKMPGIEVEKDGTVKVEGKKVKKVMVEGKSFFEGDSKLASKNIPANAVKKVEVLRDYNENYQLKQFEDNEESYAINIRLKEGKKNFWFGDIITGAGTDKRYLLHPKLFYYSPKKTYNFIGDINNIASAPMSFSDYFKFNGGVRLYLRKGSSHLDEATDVLDFSLLDNDKAKAMQTKFAAFNYNFTLNPKWNLEGYFIVNRQETELLTQTHKTYSQINLIENVQDISEENNFSSIGKISIDYQPDNNLTANYDLIIKYNDAGQNNLTTSNLRADNQTINNNNSFSAAHQLDIYKSLKSNNLITLALQHSYTENKPVLEAISKDEFFATSGLINLNPQQTFDLIQNKKSDEQKFSTLFDYYYIINNTSHIDFALGTNLSWQKFSSNIYQKYDNEQLHLLATTTLRNDAQYNFTDVFSGVYYKVLLGKFIVRPGVSLHYFHLKDQQFGDVKTQQPWYLLPELKIKLKMNRGSRFSLSYKMTNRFADIKKYAQGLVIQNYNRLSSGNRDLKNVLQHQIGFRFSKFSMSKFYHIFSGITYSRSVNSIRNTTRLEQTDFISYPVNINQNDENISVYANFGKRYIYWKYKLTGNLNWSKYYSILNQNELTSKSLSQHYNVTVNSNLSGFINFDMSYSVNLNRFDGIQNTLYLTETPSLGVELLLFKDTTQINLKYDYYNYRNESGSVHNRYGILSFELFYQKDNSPWEFILSSNNLLQNNTINKEYLSEIYVATTQYFVMPHYLMFKVKYKL
jgi:hypothetical protein